MHRRALLSRDWADLKNDSPSRKPHVSKDPFSKHLALSPSGSFDDLRFESGSSSWRRRSASLHLQHLSSGRCLKGPCEFDVGSVSRLAVLSTHKDALDTARGKPTSDEARRGKGRRKAGLIRFFTLRRKPEAA